MHCPPFVKALFGCIAGFLFVTSAIGTRAAGGGERNVLDIEVLDMEKVAGFQGGLCVVVGEEQLPLAQKLARTRQFLVQILVKDDASVQSVCQQVAGQGEYGMLSVSLLPSEGKLPYTEDLVNIVIAASPTASGTRPDELFRVLCPNGVVLCNAKEDTETFVEAGFQKVIGDPQAPWSVVRKPWPQQMDGWTHPRHSAAGNAVSGDSLVGPPRRIRWVVNAQSEVPGLVTAAGRNFYAQALARDSFNGLRLWARDLVQPSAKGNFVMKRTPANIPMPVADTKYVFARSEGKLLALDAATGETVREFASAGTPRYLLHDLGTLVVSDDETVRALDVETGESLWSYEARAAQNLVMGDEYVALIHGDARRGDKLSVTVLDKSTGKPRWSRDDMEWASRVYRTVYYRGMLAYEVSSLNNDGPGNSLYMVDARDGSLTWDLDFLPGMNHMRQARAMFVGDALWILHGGRDANGKKQPIKCSALNPNTGEFQVTHKAGLTHCFPPVATPRYMLAGELDLTDLQSGVVDANHITKAACGRESGWVPANGLIYVTPKHCTCWPMLRGYAALAPARPAGSIGFIPPEEIQFPFEQGAVAVPAPAAPAAADDWPCYRHDGWRSGSTPASGPTELETLWQTQLEAPSTSGPIGADWEENPFVKGPVTSPVVAEDTVLVARPDVHEVVALDAHSGKVRWRFRASGRVDTPPTVHAGLCLFGDKRGWVRALRISDGALVWKRRVAPVDEQIIAYGQLESPWPVPGSILVSDGIAYFAAGRQSFADGGILFFAVEPKSGDLLWVRRLDTVPQQGFYENSGLEFDNFDLLHREGDHIAMSRWILSRDGKEMSVDKWNAFAKLSTGKGTAVVPRGCWSYAPRHQRRISSYTHRRPLVTFRDGVVIGSLQGGRTLYRREFTEESAEDFNTHWMTGWAASTAARNGELPWRNNRLAEKATWKKDLFDADSNKSIEAMVLAADRVYLASTDGGLRVHSAVDGKLLAERDLPMPVWDGFAVAGGRLVVSTADGKVLCLGK